MRRRVFLKRAAGVAAAYTLLPNRSFGVKELDYPDLVVVKEGEPDQLVRKAVEALGGISNFIRKRDIVVVKPNISWDRVPAQAANTNPEIVSEVVRLCFEAGAKKVKVFDRTLNEPRRCYKRSGIEKAVKEAGGDIYHVYERKFKNTKFPEGEIIKSWEIYSDVLEADRIINIPIAKHHSVSGISLSMKNLMGFLGGNRGKFHRKFDIKINDLNTLIKPDLVILDAYRMLVRNGPSGGNLGDVELKKTVVAGTNNVIIDSFGSTFFNLRPENIPFLIEANKRGLGEININKIRVKTLSLKV